MAQTMWVYLSETERANLEARLKKGIHRARVLTRARILLLADRTDGEWRRYGKIAKSLRCSPDTVTDICKRFIMGGLETALNDKPRPGRTCETHRGCRGTLSVVGVQLTTRRTHALDFETARRATCGVGAGG